MPDWPLPAGGTLEAIHGFIAGTFSGANTYGYSATANAKGAWTQFIAATQWEARGILVGCECGPAGSVSVDACFDIGIGGVGAETVLAPDLLHGAHLGGRHVGIWQLPLAIPKGSRLSVRGAVNATSYGGSSSFGATLLPLGLLGYPACHRMMTWGKTASSGGTSVDPGGVANTKGAWTQLVAATEEDCRMVMVAFSGLGRTARITCDWSVDIAVGAAASERLIIPSLRASWGGPQVAGSQVGAMSPYVLGPFPMSIPRGSRIAARASSTNTTASDRNIGVAVHGLN